MNRNRFLRTTLALTVVAVLAIPAFATDDALSLVPANAATVGMINFAELRTSPLSSVLFEHTDRMSADGEAAQFLTEAGLSPAKDIDVLVVATAPRTNLGSEADILVIANGRFDAPRLTKALLARGAESKGAYLILPEAEREGAKPAVAFPSASLVLAGTEQAVIDALAARAANGTGFRSRAGLGLDLARVDPKASAWALVDVTRAARLSKGGVDTGKGNSGEALQAALRSVSTLAVWATDTGNAVKLGAFGMSNDAETLQLLEDTVRGALSALRLSVKDKAPEMVAVLRGFGVSRKSDAVYIEGSIPAKTLRNFVAKKHAKK